MTYCRENGQLPAKTPNLDTKRPKNRVTAFFWGPWCLNNKRRECSNLFKYAKLAKANEAFLRKGRKIAENPYFGDKMLNNLDIHFFFENRASSLFNIWNRF